MGRVVVGIDGSEGAREALDFAAQEAKLRGASLEVVYVHALGSLGNPFSRGLSAEVMSGDMYAQMVNLDQEERNQLEERARQFGERLLADAVADTDTDGISKVETTLLFDRRPAKRLVQVTRERGDVDLLVVGSRGRGELTGRLLGSVSQAVVNHARVPVTVIRPD